MPNGNLDMWLHYDTEAGSRQPEPRILKLEERISIAIDVACALEYLHKECATPVIHCDLKPSNILLDADMVAHVGDFGLARFLLRDPPSSSQSTSVGIRGTIGYTPPEYGMLSEVSQEGDIYSYGILLLEIMTGKRPTDPMFSENSNLHNYAKLSLPDCVTEVVDQSLVNDNEGEIEAATQADQTTRTETGDDDRNKCLVSMIKLGVACSMESPSDRMNIVNVVRELHSIRRIFLSRNQQNA